MEMCQVSERGLSLLPVTYSYPKIEIQILLLVDLITKKSTIDDGVKIRMHDPQVKLPLNLLRLTLLMTSNSYYNS